MDSHAAYSTASETTLIPLSQGTEVTSVIGAFPFERSLHIVYGKASNHAGAFPFERSLHIVYGKASNHAEHPALRAQSQSTNKDP